MATERQLKLTREGQARLQEELRTLREERLKELSQRIQAANEEGDISDNSEFEELKEEYYSVESRVREIQHILSRAVILEEGSVDGTINLGSRITVQADDDDEPEQWVLVNEEESSALDGRISDESPVGIALLGKKAGDSVVIKTASGQITYTIIDVN
ncbi:MAG TPA: transcription elongation factor GreA [Thermomicrobiales bacterium]|jgi:transcription elongation factor GreA|nr:transcription elongation factor GreA [Thermomicrobiales bacterium]